MKIKIPKKLQQVIPRWTKKMKKRKTFETLQAPCVVDGKRLAIGSFNCCVVGEFYNKFGLKEDDGDYGCYECRKLSLRFNDIIAAGVYKRGDTGESITDLEDKLQEFEEHIELVHCERFEEIENE